MTEDEAKQRWCPFARTWLNAGSTDNDGSVTVNRSSLRGSTYGGPMTGTFCLASACMAWRFDRAERDVTGRPAKEWPGLVPFVGEDTLMVVHGFCGLAGQP